MGETIKLVTEGRLTRLPHIVEVRFVHVDGSFYVLAGSERSDWVLNALRAGKAKVRTQELVFHVSARDTTQSEKERALQAFNSKYGGRVMKDWYPNTSICLRLTPEGAPTRRGAVKGENEATTTYGEWLSLNREYYAGVADAFDSASEEYDFTISHNYINTWIRKRSMRELLNLIGPEDTLVEVGCGTGAEALEIARYASKIIATDISGKMLEILARKVHAKRLDGKIVPLRLRASEISKVSEFFDGRKVRVAYSFNGALNLELELEKFVEGLSSILSPAGYFVCSIRNSFCFGEAISHAAVLQFDKATPRKKQPVMVSVGGMDIPAFYYSPSAFANIFSSRFELKKLVGLPAFLPPAYLSDYYVKVKDVASVLERMELALGARFPFNRMGDQSLFVFQNKSDGKRDS
jgi:SAM-dependent methyltransferase